MSAWDTYQLRVLSLGNTKRDAALQRTKRYIRKHLQDSLSFLTVTVDGRPKNVAITSTENMNEKNMFSMPNEQLMSGSMVEWDNSFWIVSEVDFSDEVYAKAKMTRCNYLLRWVDRFAVIHEQWCVIEDGTKYLIGQREDEGHFIKHGDSRVAMMISKNEDTSSFKRGDRFLIDDPSADVLLAYELTKPLKLNGVYDGVGVFGFVLHEVNATDDDNHYLRIADYHKYYPKECHGKAEASPVINPDLKKTSDGRSVWL